MSTLKYQSNLVNSSSQYNRYLGSGGFLGVDVSDDPSKINERRFANSVNMWKDYENESGIAVETMPGYRKLKATGAKINGIFRFIYNNGATDEEKYVLVHCGTALWVYTWDNFLNASDATHYVVDLGTAVLTDNKSNAFQYRNRFFFLRDGFWELVRTKNSDSSVSFVLESVSGRGYIPKTFIDGVEYEQANAFASDVINEYNDFSTPISTDPPLYSIPLYNKVNEKAVADGYMETPGSAEPIFWDDVAGAYTIPTDAQYLILRLTPSESCTIYTSLFEYVSTIVGEEETKTRTKIGEAQDYAFNKGETKTIAFSLEQIPSGHKATFRLSSLKNVEVGTSVSVCYFHSEPSFIKTTGETFDDVHWLGDETKANYRNNQTGIFFLPSKIEDTITEFVLCYRTYELVNDKTEEYEYKTKEFPVGYSLQIQYYAQPTSFASAGEYTPFASSHTDTMSDAINGCTLFDIFDDRIFMTGNPKLPNTIFYANRDNTGYVNPTYFGVLNWFDCGVSNEPITSMVHNANNLIVMKGNTIQDSVISFYNPWQTGKDIIPKAYTRNDGLPGKGCLGLACNLRDDIVFLSETGLEGIDRQTVNTERAVGHRSSLVDAKLLAEDLTEAMWCEWKDYLVVLFPSGNAYMADTRQVSSVNGYHQYEWYLLNEIVTWTNDIHAYHYSSAFPINPYEAEAYGKCTMNGVVVGEYVSATIGDIERNFCIIYDRADTELDKSIYKDKNSPILSGTDAKENIWYWYDTSEPIVCEGGKSYQTAFLLEKQEEMISATVYDAVTTEEKTTKQNMPSFLTEFNGLMLFGTDNGDICVFNTDKRGVRPARLKGYYSEQEYKAEFATTIDAEWYDRCGHAYLSAVETAFDNANIPHLTKDTIKKSCVVEVKLGLTSSFNSQFRTDRNGWSEPSIVAVKNQDFSDNDLFKADFTTNSNTTVAVTEKTKKWVVKQYRMYSKKWRTPFGIYGIAYRYSIHGRIKN